MPALARISVIIPTLAEEKGLARVLTSVLAEDVEAIVVDGGSADRTCQIAEEMGALVLHTEAGRGLQMNSGAEAATGDILLFVHGDTVLPEGYGAEVRRVLASANVAFGAFSLQLVGGLKGLRLISWGANVRSKWLNLPYGDQCLFMSRAMFHGVGGYPQTAIMEDVSLVRQLSRKGRFYLSECTVASSGRRWNQRGLVYQTLLNQMILFGFLLGLSSQRLAKIYGVRQKV